MFRVPIRHTLVITIAVEILWPDIRHKCNLENSKFVQIIFQIHINASSNTVLIVLKF